MVITGHKNLSAAPIPKYNIVSRVYKVYKIVMKDILLRPIFLVLHFHVQGDII